MIPVLTLILLPTPPPVLLCGRPLVLEPGKPNRVVVRGKNFEGVLSAKAHDPKSAAAVTGKPQKKPAGNAESAEKVGDAELELTVTPAGEVPGGVLTVSVAGLSSESGTLRFAVADGTPRLAEKEPNDTYARPQPAAFPAVIDGGFARPQDVDVFCFTGKAGQKVTVAVAAAGLCSPADCILTVCDGRGRVLAVADDTAGRPDPAVTLTLPADGEYLASLQEANDLGGPAYLYRLHLRESDSGK